MGEARIAPHASVIVTMRFPVEAAAASGYMSVLESPVVTIHAVQYLRVTCSICTKQSLQWNPGREKRT
jgi:hypothetical protein